MLIGFIAGLLHYFLLAVATPVEIAIKSDCRH